MMLHLLKSNKQRPLEALQNGGRGAGAPPRASSVFPIATAQANCSRAKAVKALRKNRNIVDAILELTP